MNFFKRLQGKRSDEAKRKAVYTFIFGDYDYLKSPTNAAAEVCKAWVLDDPARIEAHMQRYRAIGYPAHNGLYTTLIIARRHDRANVRAMCEFWWEEYVRGSRRDQLSLNYAIWKSASIKISAIDFAQQFGVNFNIRQHKSRIRLDGTNLKLETSSMNLVSDGEPLTNPGTDYIGHVDTADCYAIRGWAADRNRLNTSISVSLYEGNTLITTLPSNQLRPDVNAYLGDKVPHGFSIPIPASLKDGAAHSISVKFETSNISLPV